jgi:hypothetical protein
VSYRVLITALAALSLTGCALLPNTVSPVIEHTSHIGQHFGSHPTEYGYNEIAVVAHWRVYRGAFLDLQEGYNPGSRNSDGQACDGLYGGHEVFTARAGYTFVVRP